MSDGSRLDGLTILLVEYDFYLADDASCALQQAGAVVLGPFAHFDDAEDPLRRERPACAILDINLGDGPDYRSAETMLSKGVPVLFVTGYDRAVIPDAFRRAECLQKPTTGTKIVQAVRQLCDR